MNNRILVFGLLWVLLPLTACSSPTPQTSSISVDSTLKSPLIISAIPNQDPEQQQRQFQKLAIYLEAELDIPVQYKSVYSQVAAVIQFQLGAIDLVWFDGLRGVQAQTKVSGARAIIQREIDQQFHSLFIANRQSQLKPFDDLSGLIQLRGMTFIFSGQFSTAGRLMPQYFLQQAGVRLEDFRVQPGFSQSSEQTIQQVETGVYDAGVVNETIWQQKVDTNQVDLEQVYGIWRTPAYFNYHWVIHPQTQQQYSPDFFQQVQQAFLNLDPNVPEDKEILDLFDAERFIVTNNNNYQAIKQIGRQINQVEE